MDCKRSEGPGVFAGNPKKADFRHNGGGAGDEAEEREVGLCHRGWFGGKGF